MPTNRAVFQPFKKAPSYEVKEAPFTPPKAGEIVVKNAAVAINPIDGSIQRKGDIMFTWLKYPFVLGSDVAGEVAEVGPDVTRFRVGDRVLGMCRGSDQKVNLSSEGAFQEYSVLQVDLSCPIPANVSYERASVIPLGFGTAAAGLFEKDQLGLPLPTTPVTPTGQVLLVWGGSTSVGCNTIQLGVAAGYEVITTCSPKNFDLVKRLGASHAFDYRSKTVVADIVEAFQGRTAAGAFSIGKGGAEGCMEVLEKVQGHKFVTMATYPVPEDEPKSLAMLKTAATYLSWIAAYKVKGLVKGIKSNFIFSTSISFNGVGKAVFTDYLPRALEDGSFVPAPEPEVFGNGLEKIQEAVNYQSKGVSAKKVVVTL